MPTSGHGLVQQAKIDASQVTFNARFNEAFQTTEDPIRQIAMEVSSDGRSETYNWADDTPGLSEWLDERRLDHLRAEEINVPNRDWSSGVRVHMNDIKDDRLGVVGAKIARMGSKAARHYGSLISDFLLAGFGTTLQTGYDGVAHYSASHQDPSGPVQSNTNAAALDDAAYTAARAGMQELTDIYGDELGILPTHLLVGATQERLGLEVTQATAIANAGGTASIQNVFAGTAELLVSPKIRGAAASNWFLFDMSTTLRSMVLQIREPITAAFQSDMNGNPVFMKNEARFGSQGRHAVSYGLWQFTFGSSN